MGTIQDHRRYAEECVAMARLSDADSDKVLWLTLAQSWVRLADHVAKVHTNSAEIMEIEESPDTAASDEGEEEEVLVEH